MRKGPKYTQLLKKKKFKATLYFGSKEDARVFTDIAKWLDGRRISVVLVSVLEKDERKRFVSGVVQAFFRNGVFRPMERIGALASAFFGYGYNQYDKRSLVLQKKFIKAQAKAEGRRP